MRTALSALCPLLQDTGRGQRNGAGAFDWAMMLIRARPGGFSVIWRRRMALRQFRLLELPHPRAWD